MGLLIVRSQAIHALWTLDRWIPRSDGGPQGAEWVFTNWFAREPFRNMRKEMLEGQMQPQKSKPKKGGRSTIG